MTDTFFYLPDDRQSRLVTLYRATANGLEKSPSRAKVHLRRFGSRLLDGVLVSLTSFSGPASAGSISGAAQD